jgi:hypothetical protein
MKFEAGDWVMGSSNLGELIHGYVENVNLIQGTVIVHVVASDHDDAVGRSLEVRQYGFKKLPEGTADNEEQLKSLIDIALMTRDETWFTELTGKLIEVQNKPKAEEEDAAVPMSILNRLGVYSLHKH